MLKNFIISCRTEEDIDLIVNQLITPGIAPQGTETTYLKKFIKIEDYMPYSRLSIEVKLTDGEANLLRQNKLIDSVEEKPVTKAELFYKNQTRPVNSTYTGTNNSSHDNWGLSRCSSLSSLQPFSSTYTYLRTGSAADVVILDTGIKADHPEFFNNNGISRLQKVNWSLYDPLTANRTLNVTVPGGTQEGYYINGIQKNTIYVVKDKTQLTVDRRTGVYDFVLDGSSTLGHPFFIGSAVDVPFGIDKVTNNGAQTGTVSLTVFPFNDTRGQGQSGTMYYWCGNHSGMGGIISRTDYNTQSDDQYFYSDIDGHGTHCTSTVAGSTLGWATDANIHCIHLNFSDSYGYSTFSSGIIAAFNDLLGWHLSKLNSPTLSSRPTITSNSWGWPAGTIISSVNLAVKSLTDNGIHFVHSAGNNGALITVPSDPEFNSFHRAINGAYGAAALGCKEGSPCYPIDSWTVQENNPVFCVGALGSYTAFSTSPYFFIGNGNNALKAEYSNFGKGVSLYAPGTHIQGASINNTTPYNPNNNFGVIKYSGTSMAGPQVAGVLATMLDDTPNLSPLAAKLKLLSFCYQGTMSSSDYISPADSYYNYINLYHLSGGRNLVLPEYPPEKICVPFTTSPSLSFNGIKYANTSISPVVNNGIIFDNTVTAVNSSSNMTFS